MVEHATTVLKNLVDMAGNHLQDACTFLYCFILLIKQSGTGDDIERDKESCEVLLFLEHFFTIGIRGV